ncbi:hypothetical protein CVD28_03045 [Bacillus sp. M6-12]|uniref:hypothetical protein n=1 Tax=Bacillus sp. M6-12 TaxID=2054166 RepID=UPI000C76F67E|nr:hypothetical protein [Bacillus sp. M6-12]PLS19406.1 hypothetical protein CVD28_03045 [Bacillus sp. M6-12]
MKENYQFFNDTIEEIKQKGYFSCSNKELWEELYSELKPSIPTLYKSEDKHFYYLHIIKREQVRNLAKMIERREKLKEQVQEIDFIMKHLNIDLKELGLA